MIEQHWDRRKLDYLSCHGVVIPYVGHILIYFEI